MPICHDRTVRFQPQSCPSEMRCIRPFKRASAFLKAEAEQIASSANPGMRSLLGNFVTNRFVAEFHSGLNPRWVITAVTHLVAGSYISVTNLVRR